MVTTEVVDVVMFQMGVSVSEGTVTKWLKCEGEQIEVDESLLEISTDKVDIEVSSPATGIVTQILVQEGETVEVGTKLAVIGGEVGVSAPESEVVPESVTVEVSQEAQVLVSASESVAVEPTDGDQDGKSFVSPVVVRIAAEYGVDVSSVLGTGCGGRVTKKDILQFVEFGAVAAFAPVEVLVSAPVPVSALAPAQVEALVFAEVSFVLVVAPSSKLVLVSEFVVVAVGEQLESMNAMRRGIVEHMRRLLDIAVHVTSAIEVDMSWVVEIRNKLKPEFQKTYGVNPTYLIFVACVVVETLKQYPWINGEIRGEQIVTCLYVNLGFVVELADGKGLIVFVVKHVEGFNLLGIAQAVIDVAERVRNKKLTLDEVQGGTFTITNPGGYGIFYGISVISQPQVAILGTYAVVKCLWVVQDSFGKDVIAIRLIMNFTFTYDHRLVDGVLAGCFLKDMKEAFESWDEVSYQSCG